MGYCQALPPLCPLHEGKAVVGIQQGFLWVCSHGNHDTRASCWCFFWPNSSSVPWRPEHLWSNPVVPSSTKQCTLLIRYGFPRSPIDLPGTEVPVAACLLRVWLTVVLVRPMQPINNNTLPHRVMGKCKYFMLINRGTGWAIIRTISDNWEKHMQLLFKLATVRRQIGEITT